MAIVKPFAGIRPDAGHVSEVAALPYDVYSREEARKAVQGKPLSFLNIDRPETQFPEDQDMYAPEVYEKASDMLSRQIAEGVYIQDSMPCYYVYALTMEGRTQTGIAALSAIDDYIGNICKKHENTVEEKEQDRIRHVDICSAQTGPIFLAYRSREEIDTLVERIKTGKPVYDFTGEDNVRHQVWVISEKQDTEALEAAFRKVPATYIADGHHRAASAVKVGLKRRAAYPDYRGDEEFNYFLSVLFPDKELKILDYNRVVRDLNGMSAEAFLDRLGQDFEICRIEKAFVPENKGEFHMYISGQWYCVRAREALRHRRGEDPVSVLDVSLLQDEVLSKLLGIGDPRTDKRIAFVGGIRGLGELESRTEKNDLEAREAGTLEKNGPSVAFSMHPTAISELLNVADRQMLMPPKSTWFEPKLRSGLFIHRIER